MHTQFWKEDLKERDHLEDLGVDGGCLYKLILWKQDGKLCPGFI